MAFAPIRRSSDDDCVDVDHLFHAWEAVRRAQRVRWTQGDGERWQAEFRRFISEAHDDVVAHHQASRMSCASRERAIAATAGQARRVREHFAEHRWLRERLNDLLRTAESASGSTSEDAARLTERAIYLEIQLARHQNRTRRLLRRSRSSTEVA